MARRFETTSEWPAIFFYVQHQTFNFNVVNITPAHALAAGNSAPHAFITLLHKIYAFILPAFLAMLQVKSAGNNTTSPFQVHPLTTGVSVVGMLGYYLAFMASLRFPLYATQSSIAMAVFGSLSLASLLTLLLPDSCWYIKYIFYVLLVLLELHPLLKGYLRGPILTVRRSWPTNSTTARHLLPLTHMGLREHSTTMPQHCRETRGHHRGHRWQSPPTVGHRESPPRSWLLPLSATTSQIREPPPSRCHRASLPSNASQRKSSQCESSTVSATPASENAPLQDGGAQALTLGRRKHQQALSTMGCSSGV